MCQCATTSRGKLSSQSRQMNWAVQKFSTNEPYQNSWISSQKRRKQNQTFEKSVSRHCAWYEAMGAWFAGSSQRDHGTCGSSTDTLEFTYFHDTRKGPYIRWHYTPVTGSTRTHMDHSESDDLHKIEHDRAALLKILRRRPQALERNPPQTPLILPCSSYTGLRLGSNAPH